MTRLEYEQYRLELEPYIDKTILRYDRTDIWLTLKGVENYEEGVGEYPKAVFDLTSGGETTISLSDAVRLLKTAK